ncbi:hypothetical protein ACLESD_08680 [Pyxidicoccus sp. 3LFB2]
MISENEAVQFIAELTRETLAERIVWTKANPPDSAILRSLTSVAGMYVTQFGNWRIGVYEISYRDYFPEADEWYVASRVEVVLLAPSSNLVEFMFPEVSGMFELLRAIQAKAANVSGLLDAWRKKQLKE